MQLDLLPHRLGIARLEPDSRFPTPDSDSSWISVTRTHDELSVVTAEEELPDAEATERGWRAFRIRGPLAFDEVGILASLANTLSEADIPIFALSTYNTDYVLVKEHDLERAVQALKKAGHDISGISGA